MNDVKNQVLATDPSLDEYEIPTYEDEDEDDKHIFPTSEDRTRIMDILATLGATRIEVTFSGGGDSGEVQGATLLDAVGNVVGIPNQEILGWGIKKSGYGVSPRTQTVIYKKMSIEELLIQMTYDALEHTHLDWYNNDGGYGTLIIDLRKSPPKLSLDLNINYTESSNHRFTF